jgi:uncharacterized protein YceH (UPF0502 family)
MTDSGFAAGQVEKAFRSLSTVEDADRLVEIEARLDALERRIEELASRLAWLLELSP